MQKSGSLQDNCWQPARLELKKSKRNKFSTCRFEGIDNPWKNNHLGKKGASAKFEIV